MWGKWVAFLKANPKINAAVVVAEGAALGAVGTVTDDFLTGQLTFSKAGLHKAAAIIVSSVVIALRMAYGRNPKATPAS